MINTLISAIREHALGFPEKTAVVHLKNAPESITFGELDQRAASLAALLSVLGLRQKKVILLYPAGLDFVIAFTACLYAGVVAVPLAPPDPAQLARTVLQIESVLQDAGAEVILSDAETKRFIDSHSLFKRVLVIDTTALPAREFVPDPLSDRHAEAYIQYSSGTTGSAKGVSISHANIAHSMHGNAAHWMLGEDDIALNWVPHYYTYGLLTGILLPLYLGNTNYLIASMSVVNDPLLWLKAISRHKVTYSGCANFGYQLCVDKIPVEAHSGLDLSGWKIAVCGGEIIQADTLMAFIDKFRSAGFSAKQFSPSYGMSELTGFISASQPGRPPRMHLGRVSSGTAPKEWRLQIRHPESGQILPDEETGEICVAGPTLSEAFRAQGEYFRTGDMGFMLEGELFVTGRLKEMLIVNGKKYFPQDIEACVRNAVSVPANSTAVFSIEDGVEEKVILLQESCGADIGASSSAIRRDVLKYFGLKVAQIVWIESATLPRTRNGKLQRVAAKQAFLGGRLSVVHADLGSAHENRSAVREALASGQPEERKKQIAQTLRELMSETLNIPAQDSPDSGFFDLGMTSLLAVEFKERLQSLLGSQIRLPATFVFEYPSIAAMTAYLETRI